MRSVSIRQVDMGKKETMINLGFEGENEYTHVRIDCKKTFDQHPSAVATLAVTDPAGNQYPAIVTRDGTWVEWTVMDSDLTTRGDGEIQIIFTIDGTVIGMTDTAKTRIKRSIKPTGTTPTPIANFIQQAGAILEEVDAAIPTGGTTGQVLAKKSNADRDTEWVDQTGGGGTSDYDQLENRPQIAGVTLTGNKSLSDLGIAAESDIPDVSGLYTKPSGGIPSSDMASAVQTSLGKADSAYQKPSGGIPAADIASGVIPDPTSIIDDTAGDGDTNKTWSADKIADEFSSVSTQINSRPEVKESTKTGVDLDVADENGNVIVRLKDGHILTKNFDSGTASEVKNSTKTGVDFDISDSNGNVLLRLKDGHIITKKFESSIVNDWLFAVYCSHGDSITWQDGKPYEQGQHIGEVAKGYQTILKEKLSLSSYDNYGKSGWSMAVVNSNGIVNTILGVSHSKYDLVTIACGTNDFKLNVSIGTLGQIGDTTFDDTKFYGAYRKAIEYILTSKPTIRLVLITPLQRDADGYDVNYTNSAGHKLIDYVDAVKALGKMYSLPVVDMYANSGFTKKTLSTYTMDGLHPNDDGYKRMGGYLSRSIMNIGK